MHHGYHKSRGRGENGGGGKRVFFCLIPVLLFSSAKDTKAPAFYATSVRTRLHGHLFLEKRLGKEAAGKRDRLAVTAPPCTELGFCWQESQRLPYRPHAAWPTALPLCISSLTLESQYHLPSWGLKKSSNLPKWWQVVPGDPGGARILPNVIAGWNFRDYLV